MPLAAAIASRSFDNDAVLLAAEKQTASIRTAASSRTSDNNNNEEDNIPEVQPKYVSVSGIKNTDMPLSVKWMLASSSSPSSLPPNLRQQRQQQDERGIGQGFTSTFNENSPESLNYSSDFATAETVVNELKKRELASGKEYSAQDLEQLIREKYKGLNDNIVAIAVDMIMNDGLDMQSRVSGSFPNFRVLVSARNPLQLQQQPQGNMKASETLPQNVQNLINPLSDQDKALVQSTARSVVNDILSKSQSAIDQSILEQQIVSQYNIDSSLANIVVLVLMNIQPYSQKIIPSQRPNNNPQNQNQTQTQNNNNNTTSSSNSNNNTDHLGKQNFAGYASYNACLKSQTLEHGLSEQMALKTCTNMLE